MLHPSHHARTQPDKVVYRMAATGKTLSHRELDAASNRCTQTQLVPTMFVRMLKLPETVRAKYDVSSLKAAVHAAAPCPVEVKQKMIAWRGPIFIEYYAGTEGNGVTIANTAEWLAHRGTVGRSLVGPIHIVGEGGEECAVGEIGQVYFSGGPEFAYHKDPVKTKAAYNGKGWSSLGDVGYLDAEGYLFLTDRRAYMIISGGVNIYPQEAENILVNHPAVADVAVFGVPNEEMGEEVKAFASTYVPAFRKRYTPLRRLPEACRPPPRIPCVWSRAATRGATRWRGVQSDRPSQAASSRSAGRWFPVCQTGGGAARALRPCGAHRSPPSRRHRPWRPIPR